MTKQTLINTILSIAIMLLVSAAGSIAQAGNIEFSDPAKVIQPPAKAIGFPSHDPNLDALPGFNDPPPGYGEVAFYWWLGDPLTRQRLKWQIEQLDKAKGVMGLQINYAHGYGDGGLSYGLTYPGDPPLFSQQWWKLVDWFMQDAQQHGMAVSLSDYTLGIGQGWIMDQLLKDNPDLTGSQLGYKTRKVLAGDVDWPLPKGTLMVTALDRGTGICTDLRSRIAGGILKWHAPSKQTLVAVFAKPVVPSLDPMNPRSGPLYAKMFFGQFQQRYPGQCGKGLNFFFSDELSFRVKDNLWTQRFAEEFSKRKRYDIIPQLPALFMDIGPRTPKVRMDYRDVMVSLTEEGFFKPVFDWHQQRGMLYGCDHGGRGRDIVEFGDYFRTQRWVSGPGSDQPNLASDLIKAKVASSIAHLYQRPRVWLEGYYGSGWGTTSQQLTDATLANFAHGYNLLTLHGLYYSTHGGFWEWAPPCNHFRMSYWQHMRQYLAMVQRLSYLLSQGYHRCDVAIVYPVATMEAGLGGKESVDAAFAAGQQLYAQGIDFDFMDFESLTRANIDDKKLNVSGESYRVLILPAMRAARWSTLQKALEFQRAGGLVVLLGALPQASDRIGRDDHELNALVAQLTDRAEKPNQIAALVDKTGPRDFAVLHNENCSPNFMHRQIGQRSVFMIHNVPQDAECWFRATGKVELWDPWTGAARLLPVLSQSPQGTRLCLPLTDKEAQLIVFSPGRPLFAPQSNIQNQISKIELDGDWQFQLQPTMDNQFGDYRWPPTPTLIGPEARRFRYAQELQPNPGWQSPRFDDSKWPTQTYSFGQKFWKLGPLPNDADLDAMLAKLKYVDPSVPVRFGDKEFRWQLYEFSWRWGPQDDPGPQGYHGLKEKISDDFIVLGARTARKKNMAYDYVKEPGGSRYYLWTTAVISARHSTAAIHIGGNPPAAVYLNGELLDQSCRSAAVKFGANPLLLRYDKPGRGHFVLELPIADNRQSPNSGSLAMSWYDKPGLVPFDVRPQESRPAGWYRFVAPPGLKSMTIAANGKVQAWVDGNLVVAKEKGRSWCFQLPSTVTNAAKVALRIEQQRGYYGGAVFPEPIALNCLAGTISTGDWSRLGVLDCYSGGAWYRKTVALTRRQARGVITLDLGKVVSSAEVHVNGQLAGIRLAQPWCIDISKQVKPGKNQIEILVFNTLANQYLTIPTNYPGSPVSGLLGPVSITLENPDIK